MQVHPINNTECFQGKIERNPLFNKLNEELNKKQKVIFEDIVQRVENEQDGRIFKFDKIENPKHSGGAEVGIFERKALIDKTLWIPLWCSTRKRAVWCFEQLDKMYREILILKQGKERH